MSAVCLDESGDLGFDVAPAGTTKMLHGADLIADRIMEEAGIYG